ncbi:DUF2357 domain-containing protein [Pseudoneobacillus sp. C159]
MAIPYKEVPFQLSFTYRHRNREVVIEAPFFYTTKDDLYQIGRLTAMEIPENFPLSVFFSSQDLSARFYMDGLDTLPERLVKEDKNGGEVFLTPSLSPVVFYEIDRGESYPYIPGIYQVKVFVFGIYYYTWVKIIPKQLSKDQWEYMKEEVEKELREIANDFIQKNKSETLNQVSTSRLRQFMIIAHRFPTIMAAITDLYRKLNYSMKKKYHLVQKEKWRVMDEITIRHRVQHPESKDLIKTPSQMIHYDLPENRYLKKIIRTISSKLDEFIDSIEFFIKQLDSEQEELRSSSSNQNELLEQKTKAIEELREYIIKANKMKGAFNLFKTAPWYSKISSVRDSIIPQKMITDIRYRVLYKVEQELKRDSFEIAFDKTYSYQWKRTDRLYEMWGFLQFIKALQHEELGFNPVKGWLYDQNASIENIIIPTIPSETTITFEKEDLRIKLIYEGKLPSQSEGTCSEHLPIFTNGTNNCPDGRLDFYKGSTYIGSLLFDMKYRPKQAIWDTALIQSNQPTKTMKQLVSYAFNCRSQHLFADTLNEYLRESIRPVREVWAIYPNRHGFSETKFFKDHGVRLVELTPSLNNYHLVTELKNIISFIIERNNSLVFK